MLGSQAAQSRAISIHVPREGHDLAPELDNGDTWISIHVPREGHDALAVRIKYGIVDFNPRAPRGARPYCVCAGTARNIFQSTCPARGTTSRVTGHILSPFISIHVPREGHDHRRQYQDGGTSTFQSTCPARGTTLLLRVLMPLRLSLFQSTCPARGTTRFPPLHCRQSNRFQSTCPARGTTHV